MRTDAAPRRSIYFPGQRLLVMLSLIALPVLLAADLGSVALVKVSVDDGAGEAARAGMSAIQFSGKPTPVEAELAYRAAAEVAELHDLVIDQQSFTIYADGAVKLTATRNSPTLLFKHLPGLRDITDSTVTVTVTRQGW